MSVEAVEPSVLGIHEREGLVLVQFFGREDGTGIPDSDVNCLGTGAMMVGDCGRVHLDKHRTVELCRVIIILSLIELLCYLDSH